jgi:hypothetical protein
VSSTHGPIDEQFVVMMNAVARTLDDIFNKGLTGENRKIGFALLIYPFGEDPKGRINYIGNGEREHMLVALKELVARWEGRYIEPETTERN